MRNSNRPCRPASVSHSRISTLSAAALTRRKAMVAISFMILPDNNALHHPIIIIGEVNEYILLPPANNPSSGVKWTDRRIGLLVSLKPSQTPKPENRGAKSRRGSRISSGRDLNCPIIKLPHVLDSGNCAISISLLLSSNNDYERYLLRCRIL